MTPQEWFTKLRDDICAEFEKIETELQGSDLPAGKFERKAWDRKNEDGTPGWRDDVDHARPCF